MSEKDTCDHFTSETSHFVREVASDVPVENDYSNIWPDQIDETACWFRKYFIGKPYKTLIGTIQNDNHVIVSVIKEVEKDALYRIIVRTKQVRAVYVWHVTHL